MLRSFVFHDVWFPFPGPSGTEWCVALRLNTDIAINETAPGAADGPIWSRSNWITPMGWMRDRGAAVSKAQLIAADGVFGSNRRILSIPDSGVLGGSTPNSPLGAAQLTAPAPLPGMSDADKCQEALRLRKQAAALNHKAENRDCKALVAAGVVGAAAAGAGCCRLAVLAVGQIPGAQLHVVPACFAAGAICAVIVGITVDEGYRSCKKSAADRHENRLRKAKANYMTCCVGVDNCPDS